MVVEKRGHSRIRGITEDDMDTADIWNDGTDDSACGRSCAGFDETEDVTHRKRSGSSLRELFPRRRRTAPGRRGYISHFLLAIRPGIRILKSVTPETPAAGMCSRTCCRRASRLDVDDAGVALGEANSPMGTPLNSKSAFVVTVVPVRKRCFAAICDSATDLSMASRTR